MAELIKTLLSFSERAGEIARAIRQEPKLFALLVEEKGEGEKNQRFAHDFKTLADVLIQEALRHHVARTIPSLAEWVQGEESAEFTNTLGEKITVRICDTQNGTATLLAKVLDGNKEAAEILAALAHQDITFTPDPHLIEKVPDLPIDSLGIWIDPVDSTGEYVRGRPGEAVGSIHQQGLQCVTVLIGLYDRHSGLPIGGIINQPFAAFTENKKRWEGKVYWGVNYKGVSVHNLPAMPVESAGSSPPVVVLSSSEDPALHTRLSRHFSVLNATGAGYKQLVVALGLAAACLSSKDSTFRWDTAAPHGLLRAAGGGVVVYRRLTSSASAKDIAAETLEELQILYHKPNANPAQLSLQWCNEGGLVAYRDPKVLANILECVGE
ncbi:inositol polyphosphate 1-phosphatase-like isoform X2 [Eriocheir sinensis]|nr:inositol polyphosphate 1-phosphatase-like isoform X2 [Eriocheir sinensis]XP_050730550.1 inositol polyphosphate 1-phosphatase-like isoform X2 [Eriocheir sinensis]XP_050730551.1 inositol polyphosphate 1-phosphatase-like isoform X2 [Eriocheir sinensis]XP_050730552.1 inositol polyphosphate 1-phosphatase-like isoform X2 [Eriocheir sinensis]XP_050730553.1 inositol polyphosphate 1-phosphatase-like isoform X2 [Eriocheir sinensis]XP_050730554.1 inositol polyphosphate 1-phosphatase-like isoform X2 [E